MKIIISENAHEEYREVLKKKAATAIEERQKMLSWRYIFLSGNEIIYEMSFIISFALYFLIFFFCSSSRPKENLADLAELAVSLLPAFLISFLFTIFYQAYISIKSTKKSKASWEKTLNVCDNLSAEDFVKYMKTNYKHIYEEVELLQYLKNHPEEVLKCRIHTKLNSVEIEYSRDGKVESEDFFFDTEETRVDITEDTLIWEMGEIKLLKVYKKI